MLTADDQGAPPADDAEGVPATVGVFDNAATAMALVSFDGTFLRVNDAMCDLLGRDRTVMKSANWSELSHPDDLADVHELLGAPRVGRRRTGFVGRFLRPDGGVVAARVRSALATTDGHAVFFSRVDVVDAVEASGTQR